MFPRKKYRCFWIPESSGQQNIRHFCEIFKVRKITVGVLVKFLAVEMTAFFAGMIVCTTELYVNRLIEFLIKKIMNVYFSNPCTIQSFHSALPNASCAGKKDFDRG